MTPRNRDHTIIIMRLTESTITENSIGIPYRPRFEVVGPCGILSFGPEHRECTTADIWVRMDNPNLTSDDSTAIISMDLDTAIKMRDALTAAIDMRTAPRSLR